MSLSIFIVYKVDLLATLTSLIIKTMVVRAFTISRFSPPCRRQYCIRSTAETSWQSPPLWDFLYPSPILSRRPPGWGWGRSACSSPYADSPTVRMFSKMVKELRQSSLRMPCTYWLASPSSPCLSGWATTSRTSWRASDSWEEWHELF